MQASNKQTGKMFRRWQGQLITIHVYFLFGRRQLALIANGEYYKHTIPRFAYSIELTLFQETIDWITTIQCVFNLPLPGDPIEQ